MSYLLALLAAGSLQAATCSETSLARIESAKLLIADIDSTPEADRASVAQRAIILLDRVLREDAACTTAKSLKTTAEKALKKAAPVSEAADLEAAIRNASERVTALEAASPRDLSQLETLTFLVAGLLDLAPNDARLNELSRRLAALRSE